MERFRELTKEERQQEDRLDKFLSKLRDQVFVKSTNSVTYEEEYLEAEINDYEAVIEIRGEWDREDLKQILQNY